MMLFGVSLTAQTLPPIKTVFVISMENHNLVEPISDGTDAIFKNPAAPFINSLITPGNSNALQTTYCVHYYNVGVGVHPSEANYIWSEAGTDFGIHTDGDPGTNFNNVFNAPHLTGQLDAAGISWKNYQEDFQFATNPIVSASGDDTNFTNAYNGASDFDYAVRHNPMAFFSDTQAENIYPLEQLFSDLSNHVAGRYNWIGPNTFNDQHSPLPGGFTYNGITYTGEDAGIAQGDNFLSIILPRIMASAEYQDNGMIVIWYDESEYEDDTNHPIPAIIISPWARGNGYASQKIMSHSSDLKTMEEIFGLPLLTNAIPPAETSLTGTGYNTLDAVNDFSDLFRTTPLITDAHLLNGGFQLRFSGPTGTNYQISTSEVLTTPASIWTVVASGTFGDTNISWIDTQVSDYPTRFYRLSSP
ncbi:MAG TPA: alkaline phosphatase family protein [Verrucomicrobiae bacterium]|nr:alkaline phosphatase family protein [Verrucomicrobiae bacterium]